MTRFAIKDNIDVKGFQTTAGSLARLHIAKAEEDAGVVSAIRRSQAHHIVGKTNLDEFGTGATGLNPWFGDVANPIDKTRISGGSSSGSAAAVAVGHADIGIGTDTGGSIRIPAALCGLHGLKPTNGLVSTRGVYPLSQTLDTVGPMARTVAELRAGLDAILPLAASTPKDIDLRSLRVGRLRFSVPHTEVDDVIDLFLAKVGVQVVDVVLDDWGNARQVAYDILAVEAWQNHRELLETVPHSVGAQATRLCQSGMSKTPHDYARAMKFKSHWINVVQQQFHSVDVLISPTVATFAPLLEDLESLEWASFSRTIQFNLSGHPAVNFSLPVPGSQFASGMQIVGSLGSDYALIDIAGQLESHVTGLGRDHST